MSLNITTESRFKDTEFGVIPEDWEVSKLSELFDFANGVNADKNAYGEGIRFINVLEVINHSHIRSSDVPGLVRLDKAIQNSFSVRRGDILFNRTSETQEEVGLTSVYDDDDLVVFGGFVIRGRPRTTKIDVGYSGYAFRSPAVRRQIIGRGQGAIRANIGQADLKQVQVAFPNVSEQRAIAGALSDVNELISALDQMIRKKRYLKQAAMQQLLTGKRRLPGFNGEWMPLNMSEKSLLKARIGWHGLTTAEYLQSGQYYLVTGTDFVEGRVNWSSCCFVDELRYSQDPNIQLAQGDVLLTKDGTIGKVGYVDSLPGPATLNSGVFLIRPKNRAYDPLFLYYVLSSRIFDEFLARLQAGSTISHLYQKDFVGFGFLAPSLAEQSAIAAFLMDMDAEIAALERRRDKTGALKQGMMQELLTGNTRLI